MICQVALNENDHKWNLYNKLALQVVRHSYLVEHCTVYYTN